MIKFLLTLFTIVFARLPLNAQNTELRSQRSSPGAKDQGELHIIAFENGLPSPGLEIELLGAKTKTDDHGITNLSMSEGQYELLIPRLKSSIPVKIISREQTQVVIRLTPGEDSTHSRLEYEENVPQEQLKDETNLKIVETSKTKVRELKNDAEFEEYVVLSPKIQGSLAALIEVRRVSSSVTEVLSSEQMSRSGDSDAGASLRRVTGLTLISGKYVYVRGLGERYSAVTLNGMSLPSPEPSRRVVPFDLFPTSLLDSVIVQKSASAQLPGEFGGGLIQMSSKGIPNDPFLRISLSQGIRTGSNGSTYQGGKTDIWGFDDGTRKLPQKIRNAIESGQPIKAQGGLEKEGFAPEQLAQMARDLKPIYKATTFQDPTVPNFTVAGGKLWKPAGVKFGFGSSILRSSAFDHVDRKNATVISREGKTIIDQTSNSRNSEQEYKTAGALDLGVEITNQHKLKSSLMLVRHSTNEVKQKEVFPTPGSGSSNFNRRTSTSLSWTERELFIRQVSGTHMLPRAIRFDWRAQNAQAKRLAPDSREYSFHDRYGYYELDTNSTGNSRTWSDLNDNSDEIGSDFQVPLKLPLGDAKITFGANLLKRNRQSNTFRFHFNNRSSTSDFCDVRNLDLESGCFHPKNFRADGFVLINQTLSADSYSGQQTTQSQFLNSQFAIGEKWEFQAGLRNEQSNIEVKTYYYDSPDRPSAFAGMETADLMPSYNLTWKPSEKIRTRFAYSETLTRPEFRELAEVTYIDEETGIEGVGNPRLRGTVIQNFDLRWEYYPSSNEILSAGLFYKNFELPIEDTFSVQSDGVRKTFENARGAINRGLELESRISLRRMTRDLRRWNLASNLTLIESKVELQKESSIAKSERPLQGQAPWVANLQLQYERPTTGSVFSAIYNVVGSRITEVGTFGLPDVYEEPFHQVDLVAQQKLFSNGTIGLQARNIIDPEVRATQGEQVVRSFKRGRSYALSLTAMF